MSLEDGDVCKPIDTYEDVVGYMNNPPNWSKYCRKIIEKSPSVIRNSDIYRNDIKSNVCHSTVPDMEIPRHRQENLPRTLLCHDMANGYHDDCFINGTSEHTAYNFYNWAAIDIFCYFSHHFITLPPLSWINAAHKHGTQIIGTLITEWHEGAAICKKFLASENEYKKFADSLVAISKYFKLDGWLVNIENDVETPLVLIDFLKYFRDRLHSEIDGSVLIWYDSVTIDGKIHYQNALTERNFEFFMAVDGIFTNYSWVESHLAKSASLADTVWRRLDVFVGVDVWGRNFYGGGQFNTAAALKLIHRYNLSVAIFAQAWTHEAIPDQPRELQFTDNTFQEGRSEIRGSSHHKFVQFLMRDKAFWNSIWPYLNTKGPSMLPFTTSFCRGQGLNRRICGEIISYAPWFNLREMEYQISLAHCPLGYILYEVPTADTAAQKTNVPVSYSEPEQLEVAVAKGKDLAVEISNTRELGSTSKKISLEDECNKDLDEDGNISCMSKIKSMFHHNKKLRKKSDSESRDNSPNQQISSVNNLEEAVLSYGAEVFTVDTITTSIEEEGNQEIPDHESNEEKNKVLINEAATNLQSAVNDSEIALTAVFLIEDANEVDGLTSEVVCTASSATVESRPANHKRVVKYEVYNDSSTSPCIDFYSNDCYNGGGCLIISTPLDRYYLQSDIFSRLFFCEFECDEKLIFCFITKRLPGSREQYLNMCLNFTIKHSNVTFQAILVGRDWKVGMKLTEVERRANYVLYPATSYAREDFINIQRHMLLYHQGFYQATENGHDWDVWYYILDYPQSTLKEIFCKVGNPDGGPILLGHLGVAPYSQYDNIH